MPPGISPHEQREILLCVGPGGPWQRHPPPRMHDHGSDRPQSQWLIERQKAAEGGRGLDQAGG
jgi:hypothetical protein